MQVRRKDRALPARSAETLAVTTSRMGKQTMNRRALAALAAVGSSMCVAAQAQSTLPPDYRSIPETFLSRFQPGVAREIFVMQVMGPFRGFARGRIELDAAAIDEAKAGMRAASRSRFIAQMLVYDLDGDLRITRDEVASSSQARQNPSAIDAVMREVLKHDRNNDGVLDFDELRLAAAEVAEREAGNQEASAFLAFAGLDGKVRANDVLRLAERSFDLVDLDGDSMLSAREVQELRDALGIGSAGQRRAAQTPNPPAALPPPPRRTSDEEVHLVGIYEGFGKTAGMAHGSRAMVAIDRPGKKVTLLLCSYEPTNWSITVTPGTELRELRGFGYATSSEFTVNGAQVAAPRLPLTWCPYASAGIRFREIVGSLERMTGFSRLNSFLGSYRAPDRGFVVDRLSTAPELGPDYLKAADPTSLPSMHFPASLKDGPGLYDLSGRLLQRGRVIDPRSVIEVPSRGERYRIAENGIERSAMDGKGKPELIRMSLDVPRLSWPSGIAYDSRRNRILMVSYGGEGFLYEYLIDAQKWRVVTSMNDRDVASLIYDEVADALYALEGPHGPNSLVKMDPEGRVLQVKTFPAHQLPGFTDLYDPGNGHSNTSLVAVAGSKAVLVSVGNQAGQYRIYLLDRSSGSATLTGFAG
jgi:Ca2+-binding EF-hand superfamily protein